MGADLAHRQPVCKLLIYIDIFHKAPRLVGLTPTLVSLSLIYTQLSGKFIFFSQQPFFTVGLRALKL